MDNTDETNEALELELIAAYEALLRTAALSSEDDTYSLAQSSPYRFVPSVLSDHVIGTL